MREDPIVREVREIRHEIEGECERDAEAFYEWLIASQQKLKGRLVRRQPKPLPVEIKKELR
jgi:hypothetical protein